MIKLIAFDLVGVLVSEKPNVLTEKQDKIERFFGKNYSDEQFYIDVESKHGFSKNETEKEVDYIINNLYCVKDASIFEKIKNIFNGKVVIATNHISKIKNFIQANFNVDDIFISAKMQKAKPDEDFYLAIAEKFDLKPSEILFVDDSQTNVDGALAAGLKAVKVERNADVYELVIDALEKENCNGY